MSEIVLDHITKIFPDGGIGVEDLTIQIEKGEFVFIIGRSGAGKSTLLKLLTKQYNPTSGEIYVKNQAVCDMPRKQIPLFRRKFGIMERELGLLNDRTVYDNIAFAMLATEYPRGMIQKRSEEALGVVGLKKKRDAYPKELSVGEAARVLLARAIVTSPDILVADEPTANLDPDTAWDMMCLLDEINRQGVTVIVASHARQLVTIMKKRVITLVDGRMIKDEKHGRYDMKAMDVIEHRKVTRDREREKNTNFR